MKGELTGGEEEEELSFVPAASRRENWILSDNEPEEQNASNTQEVDKQEDNQNFNAPLTDNIAQAEAPMEQNDRPQRSRRPPERLEYLYTRTTGVYFNPQQLYVQCVPNVFNHSCLMHLFLVGHNRTVGCTRMETSLLIQTPIGYIEEKFKFVLIRKTKRKTILTLFGYVTTTL